MRRITQRTIADLCAKVVKRAGNGPDVALDPLDQILDRAIGCGVEQRATRLAAVFLDRADELFEPCLIRSARQYSVIAAPGKARRSVAADPCACTDHQKHLIRHCRRLP